MARGKLLTTKQEIDAANLYKEGITIKEIMSRTEIKSEQTIYRILDEFGIPRRPKLKGSAKMFFTLEADVVKIIENQPNMTKSIYVNEAIRCYDKRQKKTKKSIK